MVTAIVYVKTTGEARLGRHGLDRSHRLHRAVRGLNVVGFFAARWRRGDLHLLNEWGSRGGASARSSRGFCLGGDIYTAYTFIAVPALMFGAGAIGFFAVPYTIIIYPFAFLVFPKLWQVANDTGS